jgi:hypothetical protein
MSRGGTGLLGMWKAFNFAGKSMAEIDEQRDAIKVKPVQSPYFWVKLTASPEVPEVIYP